MAIGLAQAQNAQARPVGLLRMRPGSQKMFDERLGRGADLGRPAHQPSRRPVQVFLVLRQVLGHRGMAPLGKRAGVAGHPLAAAEHFDHGSREPDVNLLSQETIRHRVVMSVHLNVAVDVDPGQFPLGELVGGLRQGGEGGLVGAGEQGLPVARQFLEGTGVHILEQLADGLIEFGQAEETPVAQPRQDPALDDEQGAFHLGLVPGFPRPDGQYGHAMVGSEFPVGGIEFGVVEGGVLDAALEVFGHQDFGNAAIEGEHPAM